MEQQSPEFVTRALRQQKIIPYFGSDDSKNKKMYFF